MNEFEWHVVCQRCQAEGDGDSITQIRAWAMSHRRACKGDN